MSRWPLRSVVAALAVAVVAGAIVAGLRVAGPPADERARRLDERRVQDLREISEVVNAFARREARLPMSLEALANRPERTIVTRDPESHAEYGYRPIEGLRYELCAEFQLPTDEDAAGRPPASPFWRHPAGRHCFVLDAPESEK